MESEESSGEGSSGYAPLHHVIPNSATHQVECSAGELPYLASWIPGEIATAEVGDPRETDEGGNLDELLEWLTHGEAGDGEAGQSQSASESQLGSLEPETSTINGAAAAAAAAAAVVVESADGSGPEMMAAVTPEPAAAKPPTFKTSLFDDTVVFNFDDTEETKAAEEVTTPITKDDFIAPTFNWDSVKDRTPDATAEASSLDAWAASANASFDIPETLAAQRQPLTETAAAAVKTTSLATTSPASMVPAPETQVDSVRSFLYPGDDALPDDVNMSIWEHLDELRDRALISAGAVTGAVLLCFCFAKDLVLFLEHPVAEEGVRFLQLGPGEYFFTTVKVAGYCGLLGAAPIVLYEAIAYVLPGLTKDERKFLGPIVFGSSILFYAGIAFAYAVLTPAALKFFIGYADEAVESLWSIDQYFEFVLVLLFSTGLSFQVPVIQLLLGQSGIVSSQQMLSVWKYVVVGSVVVAAVLTPSTDPFTQMLLAVPLMSLYLGGAALVGVVEKGRDQLEA